MDLAGPGLNPTGSFSSFCFFLNNCQCILDDTIICTRLAIKGLLVRIQLGAGLFSLSSFSIYIRCTKKFFLEG